MLIIGCISYITEDKVALPEKEVFYDAYTSELNSMLENLNVVKSYKNLDSGHRCIIEFAWGLNKGTKHQAILKDHYIDIAQVGIEVTLNAIGTIKLDGANACFSAYQAYPLDIGLVETRKECFNKLKDGYFGDFPDVNLDSYNTYQQYSMFALLNSSYLEQLPFSNAALTDYLGACAEPR